MTSKKFNRQDLLLLSSHFLIIKWHVYAQRVHGNTYLIRSLMAFFNFLNKRVYGIHILHRYPTLVIHLHTSYKLRCIILSCVRKLTLIFLHFTCRDFWRKYLDRNSSAFVEETDSDVDVSLDDVLPSVYNNVINHIQSVPRVVNTWVNRENDRKFKFECSINLDEMYSNYVKKLKKNKKMANKKQYKKIYNMYVEKTFMRNDSMTLWFDWSRFWLIVIFFFPKHVYKDDRIPIYII